MSTIKVDTIDSKDSTGNITISRPIVATLTAGSINNLNNLLTPANASVTAAKMATTDTLPAWNGSALTNLPTPANDSVGGAQINLSLIAGDTMYASGTDTLARLPKGTAAQVLTMNGGGTAPSWADAAGGGKILQVPVPVHKTDSFTTSLTSYVDVTGVTLNITPSATTSKVMVFLHLRLSPSANGYPIFAKMLRDSTVIGSGSGSSNEDCFASATPWSDGSRGGHTSNLIWLDAPNSTSALTYKLQVRMYGSGAGYVGRSSSVHIYGGDYATSLTLMEIGV